MFYLFPFVIPLIYIAYLVIRGIWNNLDRPIGKSLAKTYQQELVDSSNPTTMLIDYLCVSLIKDRIKPCFRVSRHSRGFYHSSQVVGTYKIGKDCKYLYLEVAIREKHDGTYLCSHISGLKYGDNEIILNDKHKNKLCTTINELITLEHAWHITQKQAKSHRLAINAIADTLRISTQVNIDYDLPLINQMRSGRGLDTLKSGVVVN